MRKLTKRNNRTFPETMQFGAISPRNDDMAELPAQVWRSSFDNAAQASMILDPENTIIAVNKQMEELSGLKSSNLLHRKCWSVFHGSETASGPADCPCIAMRRSGKTEAREIVLEGSGRCCVASSAPVFDASGKLDFIIYSLADIYEPKRTEKSLRDADERLRNVIAGTSAGTWEWNVQTGEVVIDEKSAAMLGYSLEELQPLDFERWMTLEHPDDLKESRQLLASHLRGESESYSFESRKKRKDGGYAFVKARGKVIERDNGNKPLRMFGIHIDVTEEKRTEEALKEKNLSLSHAEKVARIGYWKLFLESRQIEISPGMAEIFGVSQSSLTIEEARGMDLPEYRGILGKALDDLVMNGVAYDVEFRVARFRDGAIIDVRSVADYDRGSNTIFGVVMDITEQKRSEAKIRRLLEEKELILKEVHHRIKNNMATMMSLLSLQTATMRDPAAIAALMDAENRLRSMAVLYDRLYRSENPQAMPARDYLLPLAQQIVQGFPNSGSVTIEADIGDFRIWSKELGPLGIIVNEILSNTMKYAFLGRPDGVITISASEDEGNATIIIADNGVGIAEAVDKDRTGGFGLMLVEALTRQLDGNVRWENTEGTRTVLSFPLGKTS